MKIAGKFTYCKPVSFASIFQALLRYLKVQLNLLCRYFG
jgi:hypothetical protein